MPAPTAAGDISAEIARNHSHAIEGAMAFATGHDLATLMTMLDDRLSLLKETLARWQDLLGRQLPPDDPEALIPLEMIDTMLASIVDLRQRIAATA